MFGYYFNLALRSLRRNVVLTALMIAAIGVGIGAAAVLLLGQAAVLWPALKAASIPPALATRGGA